MYHLLDESVSFFCRTNEPFGGTLMDVIYLFCSMNRFSIPFFSPPHRGILPMTL